MPGCVCVREIWVRARLYTEAHRIFALEAW